VRGNDIDSRSQRQDARGLPAPPAWDLSPIDELSLESTHSSYDSSLMGHDLTTATRPA